MSGKSGTAKCGHVGEYITANYVQCSYGCDSAKNEKLIKGGGYTKMVPGLIYSADNAVWYDGHQYVPLGGQAEKVLPYQKSIDAINSAINRLNISASPQFTEYSAMYPWALTVREVASVQPAEWLQLSPWAQRAGLFVHGGSTIREITSDDRIAGTALQVEIEKLARIAHHELIGRGFVRGKNNTPVIP